jgi:murein DD-endopeptidase MepM/ murein hydrolase activator NlpD
VAPAADTDPIAAPAAEAPPAPETAQRPAPPPIVNPVPGGRVSLGWGDAIHPFTGEPMTHLGLDLAAAEGTPVHAAGSGVVVKALVDAEGRDTGRYVIIDHGGGWSTYYGHLGEVEVAVGDTVEEGETIATVGMTGLTTGPHVHFELRRDGERLDPRPAMP